MHESHRTDQPVVVDASVLAAITFGEVRGQEGAALLRDRRVVAPTLLWYEMSEVARTKCIARPDETAALLAQLESARRLPITLYEPDWSTLSTLALETGLTAYDAAYLQLARALGARPATFDARLQAQAG